jgi:superfamily II DNA/RNA helicase
VLDEADHMADLGFLPAVTRIIDQTPGDGQRMLFSATLDRNVGQLVTRYTTDAALHAVTTSTDSGPAEHRVLVLSAQDKVAVAAEIASRPGRTLFFVRTKHGADRLVKQLTRAGVEAAAIHGDRNQNQRQRALDAFAAGHPRVLVATDVAARGIHVDDVDLVVQFDPPNDHKDYLHRSGRTARAGASGMVIALVERGQLRELRRLHDAAGVTAASDEVEAGHHVVRQIAASGTPVPPAPQRPARERPASERKPAPRGHSRRRGNGPRSAGSVTADRAGSSRTGSNYAGSSSRALGTDRTGSGSRADGSNRAGGGARTGSGRRAARIAAGGREDASRGTARGATRGAAQGTANPGRRSQSAHRPHQLRGNQYAAKSA